SHHSLEVTKKDQLDIVDDLSSIYDEPFSDSSQIPSIILSKYTKKYVKVALTGDGADEIFYGYNRYIFSKSLWKKIKYLPKNIKKLISYVIYNIRPTNWIRFQNFLNKSILTKNSLELLDEKMYKIGDSLNNSTNILENYMSHLMIWQKNENISNFKINNNLEKRLFSEIDVNENNFDYHVNMLDIKSYLPDDILVKTDRASMKFGLETRAPYLSSDLLKLSNQMPINYKTDKKKGKLILRELLREYLPNKFTDGPKKGFSIPMNDWLNDSLKEWVEDYLNSGLVLNNNFINHQIVKKFWTDHKKGKKKLS
ncbi:asparagine synthase C-terminal domain-containing protein, partial [Candidatus Pelagibacter sp.]|nr:asparagine synthase C-terminal domain-containing protein [Candidatus Pelagibacter sp.]